MGWAGPGEPYTPETWGRGAKGGPGAGGQPGPGRSRKKGPATEAEIGANRQTRASFVKNIRELQFEPLREEGARRRRGRRGETIGPRGRGRRGEGAPGARPRPLSLWRGTNGFGPPPCGKPTFLGPSPPAPRAPIAVRSPRRWERTFRRHRRDPPAWRRRLPGLGGRPDALALLTRSTRAEETTQRVHRRERRRWSQKKAEQSGSGGIAAEPLARRLP